MNVYPCFEEFITKSKYKPYHSICRSLLMGGHEYSLDVVSGCVESGYLGKEIERSVTNYTRNKDNAIAMYKDLVKFLADKGIEVKVTFPPIPVSVTFERLMFIAKYLQNERNSIDDLTHILWVGKRTISDDLKRLQGIEDPIQICGKQFRIPDVEEKNRHMKFASTAHPIFLAENLTQVIVMLKGLKAMAADPLYEPYAMQSAREIWNQLSDYAKWRIGYVFRELIPEELDWYESLEGTDPDSFHTETACSQVHNAGPSVLMDCMKNGKTFCVEYEAEDGNVFYKDCEFIPRSYRAKPGSIDVTCSSGEVTLEFSKVLRSAYTVEELLAI